MFFFFFVSTLNTKKMARGNQCRVESRAQWYKCEVAKFLDTVVGFEKGQLERKILRLLYSRAVTKKRMYAPRKAVLRRRFHLFVEPLIFHDIFGSYSFRH